MPELVQLPTEVLDHIGSKVPLNDLKALRLTCQKMNAQCVARILKKIIINFSPQNYEKELSKLRCFASGQSEANTHTKELEIASLSSRYTSLEELCDMEEEDYISPDDENLLHADAEIAAQLPNALAALTSVQLISWRPGWQYESKNLHAVVKDFVQSRAVQLRMFSLDTVLLPHDAYSTSGYESDNTTPSMALSLPFAYMTAVESFDFRTMGANHFDIDELAHSIAQSRVLRSFCFDRIYHDTPAGGDDVLHDILQNYPLDAPALRLKKLQLYSATPLMDNICLRHLQHLTDLTLECDLKFISDRETSKRDALLTKLWDGLRTEQIKLQFILINFPVAAFLTYLESYSGLKTFVITGCNSDQAMTFSKGLGRRFFEESISNHYPYLQVLDVKRAVHADWSFSQNNTHVFLKCGKLRELSIVVAGMKLRGNHLSLGGLQLLFSKALTLPFLEKLTICHDLGGKAPTSAFWFPTHDEVSSFFRVINLQAENEPFHVICWDSTFQPVSYRAGIWRYVKRTTADLE